MGGNGRGLEGMGGRTGKASKREVMREGVEVRGGGQVTHEEELSWTLKINRQNDGDLKRPLPTASLRQ